MSPKTYRILLVFWGVLLILSLGSVTLNVWTVVEVGPPPPIDPGVPTDTDNGEPPVIVPEDSTEGLSLTLSLISAVAAAGGFIVTTVFALREDRRDSATHALEVENLRKEIEQKKLEIARLRREQGQQTAEGT